MDERLFECRQWGSSKFWAVSFTSSSTMGRTSVTVTIRYGPIGSRGTTYGKVFPDGLAAIRFMDRKMREKLGKGYTEVTEVPDPMSWADRPTVQNGRGPTAPPVSPRTSQPKEAISLTDERPRRNILRS